MSLGLRSLIDLCSPLNIPQEANVSISPCKIKQPQASETLVPQIYPPLRSSNLLSKWMDMYRGSCLSCLTTWGHVLLKISEK